MQYPTSYQFARLHSLALARYLHHVNHDQLRKINLLAYSPPLPSTLAFRYLNASPSSAAISARSTTTASVGDTSRPIAASNRQNLSSSSFCLLTVLSLTPIRSAAMLCLVDAS